MNYTTFQLEYFSYIIYSLYHVFQFMSTKNIIDINTYHVI